MITCEKCRGPLEKITEPYVDDNGNKKNYIYYKCKTCGNTQGEHSENRR